MPLTFPTSPTNGQTVTLSGTTYTYNATKGVWEATASGAGDGSSVTSYANLAAFPSSGNTAGDFGFATDMGLDFYSYMRTLVCIRRYGFRHVSRDTHIGQPPQILRHFSDVLESNFRGGCNNSLSDLGEVQIIIMICISWSLGSLV